jgi:hypothetical protein
MGTRAFKTNDYIYNLGEPSEIFYIVRTGKLVYETVVEQETNMKFPV